MVLMKQEQIPSQPIDESKSVVWEDVLVGRISFVCRRNISNDSISKKVSMTKPTELILNDDVNLYTKQANVFFGNDTMRGDYQLTVVDRKVVVSMMVRHTKEMIVCFQSVSFEYSDEIFCPFSLVRVRRGRRRLHLRHSKELDKNYRARVNDQHFDYIADNPEELEMDRSNDAMD